MSQENSRKVSVKTLKWSADFITSHKTPHACCGSYHLLFLSSSLHRRTLSGLILGNRFCADESLLAMQNIWFNISIFHHALTAERVNGALQFPRTPTLLFFFVSLYVSGFSIVHLYLVCLLSFVSLFVVSLACMLPSLSFPSSFQSFFSSFFSSTFIVNWVHVKDTLLQRHSGSCSQRFFIWSSINNVSCFSMTITETSPSMIMFVNNINPLTHGFSAAWWSFVIICGHVTLGQALSSLTSVKYTCSSWIIDVPEVNLSPLKSSSLWFAFSWFDVDTLVSTKAWYTACGSDRPHRSVTAESLRVSRNTMIC